LLGAAAMSASVTVRGNGGDLLHEVVRTGFAELQRTMAAEDRYLPRYVVREVEAFLVCGDPEEGFAWLMCKGCDHHELVPFSCKGRGFCPACGGRRMAERAAAWVDTLFPHVAVRQWVLTVPFERRVLLARRPELARGVLSIALGLVTRWLREKARAPDGRTGSVTVQQRFGSALNLNLHYHSLQMDGLFVRDKRTRKLSFRRVKPTTADVEELVVQIRYACEDWLKKQGCDEDVEPDDGLAILQAASVVGDLATRGGRKARRTQTLGGREYALPPLCAGCDGYTLHAGTVVDARDRSGLEHLCRYVNRPPLAKSRLEARPDGTVSVGMKRVFADGTSAFVYTPEEFAERLCAIVPPPRANQTIYHGIFAGNSAWRPEVVPKPPAVSAREKKRREARRLTRQPSASPRTPGWAYLLARVFQVDPFRCPHCGKPMELRCVVVRPPASSRILRGLGAPRAPPTPTP